MESIIAALALVIVGYTAGSVKIINQGNEALVERLGRYHRKLTPGLNLIVPILDNIVLEESLRERVLDTEPQEAITNDSLSVEVDAVIYWRIMDLELTFYEVEDVETALKNLVLTTMRSQVGQMALQETYSSRDKINHALLQQLDEATATWGVKVTRVEVQNITPSKSMLESLELQRTAENKRQADISEAQGTVKSIQLIAAALKEQPNSYAVLQYLLAQKYVDANYRLGQSANSKIIFMNPKDLTEGLAELISPEATDSNGAEFESSDAKLN
jgi:regulator of protease activity HflC (stomatin/prohibitin superfamily)